MKKGSLLASFTALAVIAVLLISGCVSDENGSTAQFTPGTYSAAAPGNYGDVPVEVSFSKTKIKKITVGSNSETPGIGGVAMEKLTEEIIDGQTLAVDAITGATNSSRAFLTAVEDCVAQAGGDILMLKNKKIAVVAGEEIKKTADVIIIGGGGAGLAAAVSASGNGSSVILIEKAAALGGNTIRSGGGYNSYDPQRQKAIKMTKPLMEDLESFLSMTPAEAGDFAPTLAVLKDQIREYKKSNDGTLFDSPELHMMQTYIGGKRTSLDGKEITGNVDLVKTFTSNTLPTLHWLESIGLEFSEEVATILGALWPRSHTTVEHVGAGFINTLSRVAAENGVDIMLETKASEIVKDENGRVVGVIAKMTDGTPVTLTAEKGVIMTTGGYGANPEMIAKYNTYWPDIPKTMKTTNTADAMGDGIVMGTDAGADLVGMGFVQLMPSSDPENGALSGGLWGSAETQVFVNKSGKRFVNEYAERDVLASGALSQQDALFYIICDQVTAGNPQPGGKNFWGDDIDTLIATQKVYKADTLAGLEEQLGMPAGALETEIAKYNSFIEQGSDPDFGKRNFGPKLVNGPFYATPRSPSVHHTMGGLRIDTSARVLDADGTPIPGFYAAGEVTGGIHAGNRLGGNAISDIMTFGRIAGNSASSEL